MDNEETDFTSDWDLADQRVKTEDGSLLYVDRMTLCLWSPVFKAMLLSNDFKDKDKSEVELLSWKKDDLVEFFKLLHPPGKAIDETNVSFILPLADHFQIQRFVDESESVLVNGVDQNSCMEKSVLAEKYKLAKLEENCIKHATGATLGEWESSIYWNNLNSKTKEKLYQSKIVKLEKPYFLGYHEAKQESHENCTGTTVIEGTDFTKEWDLSDLQIKTEDGSLLYVNRMTLCLWSPVFKAMLFTSDFIEKDESLIKLPEWKKDDLVEFFKILHPPGSHVDENNVSFKLPLADFFRIQRVKDEGEVILLKSVNETNCIEKCVYAEKYKLDKLKETCMEEAYALALKQCDSSVHWDSLSYGTKEKIYRRKSEKMDEYKDELVMLRKYQAVVNKLETYAGILSDCARQRCHRYTLSSDHYFRSRCSNDCDCVRQIALDIKEKLNLNV